MVHFFNPSYMAKQSEDIQLIKQRFGIIGTSEDLNRDIEIAMAVSPTDLSVLILGESGVGKETFPQIIHQASLRKHGTYIAVNCGSIPEGTIDSELFGHEKGSFTGAVGARKGYFEVANGGTLFLDEVGELPLSTQARLLRVLETGEFIKVGSSKVEKTDVRVVAATNLNMIEATRNGKFREDLYYRLNTVPIRIPALRERKNDIPLLFRKFAGDLAEKYSMTPVVLTEGAKEVLMKYRWPGNIRQLKNITEQISILETTREISREVMSNYLPKEELGIVPVTNLGATHTPIINDQEFIWEAIKEMKIEINDLKKLIGDIVSKHVTYSEVKSLPVFANSVNEPAPLSLPISLTSSIDESNHIEDIEYADDLRGTQSLHDMEKEMIIQALKRHNGKRKNAAQDLKISERTLYRKIKDYHLENL